MKSVLHLNASSRGGAFVVAQRLSEALSETGKMQSGHLVYSGNPGNYFLWANNVFRKGIAFGMHALEKLDFLRYEKNKSIRFAFSHGLTGIPIYQNQLVQNADIIHLHWINKGFISLSGLKKIIELGKPVIWTTHDMWLYTGGCYHNRGCNHFTVNCGNCPYLKKPEGQDLSYRVFNAKKKLLSSPNLHLVAPSNWLADIAMQSGVALKKSPIVIPNGIDTQLFRPEDKIKSREKLGIPVDKKVLLFIAGNLSNPYKGFQEFTEMFAELRKTSSDFHAVVVGNRNPGFELNNPSYQWFVGVGNPEILRQFYNATDLYVTTSLEENLPTTVVESISCGTPVAGFEVGGIRDILPHLLGNYLAPKGDKIALASLISDFFQLSEMDLAELSNFARKQAETVFDIRVVAQQYLNLYANLF
ncbi:MAG: glycosyltransferase [Bacteroidetes bacterium]|nr:glycosyltransferase [Bacteroidota bacterium]